MSRVHAEITKIWIHFNKNRIRLPKYIMYKLVVGYTAYDACCVVDHALVQAFPFLNVHFATQPHFVFSSSVNPLL